MSEAGEISWWRLTRLLAAVVMSVGGGAAILIMLLAPALDGNSLAGIPNGVFAATVIVPVFVLLLIFWSVARQRRIDQARGYFRD